MGSLAPQVEHIVRVRVRFELRMSEWREGRRAEAGRGEAGRTMIRWAERWMKRRGLVSDTGAPLPLIETQQPGDYFIRNHWLVRFTVYVK